jgi:ABC-type dipeptide/oligopeptide/nickel transport system permease component
MLLVVAASVPVVGVAVLLHDERTAASVAMAGVPLGTFLALAFPAFAIVADRAARRTAHLMQTDAVRGLAAFGLAPAERLRHVVRAVVRREARSSFLLLQALVASVVVAEVPFDASGLGALTLRAARTADAGLFAAGILWLGAACVAIDLVGRLVAAASGPRGSARGVA